MSRLTLKYKDDIELKQLIQGLKKFARIIKISQPKKGDVWTKVYVDIELYK